MKKIVFLITSIAILFGFKVEVEENYGHFYLRKNSSKDVSEIVTNSIDGKDVYALSFGIHLHPSNFKDIDLIKVIVTRGQNATEGVYQFTGDQIRNLNNESPKYPEHTVLYPKIIDYKKSPSNGQGVFYHSIYNRYFNGNYYLSRKGIDYSTSEEVDEYELCAHVVGYKIVKYVDEYVNGQLKNVPVYSDPIYLVPVQKINIKTDGELSPMEKSSNVGDANDLKNINFSNPYAKKSDEKITSKVKEICDCFAAANESGVKKDRMSCIVNQKKIGLKLSSSERKKFIQESNKCKD